MNDSDLAILVPLWRRTDRFHTMLASAVQTAPGARVVFIVSDDDRDVLGAALRALPSDVLGVPWPGGSPGDYAKKVNAGCRQTTEPLLFLAADDIVFHPGWFDACLAKLEPGIGVVGCNDGTQRSTVNQHSTHSLVLRSYADEFGTIDEPGKILHEGYEHEFVDDELVGTAQHRGAYAFAADSLVEHCHSDWGKAPRDELYARGPERMRLSRPLFEKRQALWQ